MTARGLRDPLVSWALRAARVAVPAGLAADAYVHLDLAGTYGEAGGVISESVLFRAEAVVALLAAIVALAEGAAGLAALTAGTLCGPAGKARAAGSAANPPAS